MNYVVFLSGIWIFILPHMSWNKNEKKFLILHIITGLCICLSVILNLIDVTLFGKIWTQMAYFLLCFLDLLEIVKKIKSPKAMLDIVAIIVSIIGLMLSLLVFLIDSSAVDTSILMITGTMIILSVPFNRVSDKYTKNFRS